MTSYQGEVKSGLLQITVHNAKKLRKADIFGKGDPYFIVKVNKERVYTSTIKHGTDNPRYEESVHVS